jgi:hypothetical protein
MCKTVRVYLAQRCGKDCSPHSCHLLGVGAMELRGGIGGWGLTPNWQIWKEGKSFPAKRGNKSTASFFLAWPWPVLP